MLKFLNCSVAGLALAGFVLTAPAFSQSDPEMAVRMGQIEEQMRLLMGQVEELTFEVKQLRGGLGKAETGALEKPLLEKPLKPRKFAIQQTPNDALVEQQALAPVEEGQIFTKTEIDENGAEQQFKIKKAPGPKILGSITEPEANEDTGFQGKVLVAPAQQEPEADSGLMQQQVVEEQAGDGMKTVALASDTPDALYERSYENLFRRRFSDAELGFREFVQKYPEHGLTGAAQYWLGETFYAQQDYRQAAEAFLLGYKQYPKSRRAPDSLLKLGISLDRLGQKQQACAAYGSVTAEYPKAVEARKRAQAAAKNAGCAS